MLVEFECKIKMLKNDEKLKIVLEKKKLNILMNSKVDYKEDDEMVDQLIQLLK